MFASTKYTPTPRKLKKEKTTLSSISESEKEPVHVYCRLRPVENDCENMKLISPQEISVVSEFKGFKKEMRFTFRHVFTSCYTQKEIFQHLAYPLLEDLINGKNGLLFTYGVTGSGKTFTLTGDETNPGIMPRCIYTIFNTIGELQAPKYIIKSDRMNGFEIQTENDAVQERLAETKTLGKTPKSNRKLNSDKVAFSNEGSKIPLINENNIYAVFVTYIEIYNNNVYDLLDESHSGKTLHNKILREDSQRNMYVNGVTEVEVKSAQDAFEVFGAGQKKKKMAFTNLNAESSRSHSVFTIRIVQLEQMTYRSDGKPVIQEKNMLTVAQLSLVDLAGSERTNRTQNTGARLKEASCINNSLMSLRTCLEILRENQRSKTNKVVPYRDSRLTYLFKNYFESDGNVQMIVCVKPSYSDLEENLHVMKFAEMSQDIKITKPQPKKTSVTIKRTIAKRVATPAKVRTQALFTGLPEFPLEKLNFDDVEECAMNIDCVIKAVKLAKPKMKELFTEIKKSSSDFRKKLVDFQQNCMKNETDATDYQRQFHIYKQKNNNLLSRKTNLEFTNRNLAATKIALASEKMSQELDSKLKKQRDHINAALKTKEIQLQKVREAHESEIIVGENVPQQTPKTTSSNYLDGYTPRRRSRSAD